MTAADQTWIAVIELTTRGEHFTAADVAEQIGEDSPTLSSIRDRLDRLESRGLLKSEGGQGRSSRVFRAAGPLKSPSTDGSGVSQDPRSVPYPGGKSKLEDWVRSYIPAHKCYVEPFAGSAAVMINKPRSRTEVLNDTDQMLMRAYRTIRDRGDELSETLQATPFHRDLHEEWSEHLDTGDWPSDDLEATRRWFFLRYSQHSAKLTRASGFKTARTTNPASAFDNAVAALPALADRLDSVILESDDWESVADRFDGEETVMYFDPPYAEGKGDELYRHTGTFDHARLAEWVSSAESDCLISYEKIPESFNRSDYHVVSTETEYSGSAREGNGLKQATERLLLTFNPEEKATFVDSAQTKLL